MILLLKLPDTSAKKVGTLGRHYIVNEVKTLPLNQDVNTIELQKFKIPPFY